LTVFFQLLLFSELKIQQELFQHGFILNIFIDYKLLELYQKGDENRGNDIFVSTCVYFCIQPIPPLRGNLEVDIPNAIAVS
jgi:hypothetical protein